MPDATPNTPDRSGHYLIRGACVVSMDETIGVRERCDILVKDGLIQAVEPELDPAGVAEVLEADGMIAMPGMIDTHTHMWNSLHRGLPAPYFELSARLGPHYRPGDSYNAVLLASVQALASGITTLHNYAHNNQSPEHTDAEIQAMLDSGARGRFSYAWYQGQRPDQQINLSELGRVFSAWNGVEGRLSVGYGARNDFELVPEFPTAAAEPDVLAGEWRTAREVGMPLVTHAGDTRAGLAPKMLERGYIERGVLLVHGYYFDADDLRVLADHDISLSTCPLTGQRSYRLLPPVRDFLDAGVGVCYSFDSTYSSGGYDMFRLMRAAVDSESVRLREHVALSHLASLRASTIDAAEALGIADEVGSLRPGKRADVVLLRTGLRVWPVTDPVRMIVDSASPGDVDTVLVGGVLRKRGGVLVGVDEDALRTRARDTLDHVLAAGGLRLSHDGSTASWVSDAA